MIDLTRLRTPDFGLLSVAAMVGYLLVADGHVALGLGLLLLLALTMTLRSYQ